MIDPDLPPAPAESTALKKAREKRLRAIESLKDAISNLELVTDGGMPTSRNAISKPEPLGRDESTESENINGGDSRETLLPEWRQQQAGVMQLDTSTDELLAFHDIRKNTGNTSSEMYASSRSQPASFPDSSELQFTEDSLLEIPVCNSTDPTDMQSERDRALTLCLQFREKVAELKKSLREKEKLVHTLEGELSTAEESKTKSKELFVQMMGKVKEGVDNQVHLETELRKSQDETVQLAAGMKKMRTVIERLEQELEQRQQENQALQDTIEQYEMSEQHEDIDILGSKLAKCEKELSVALRERQQARDALEQTQQDFESARKEMQCEQEKMNADLAQAHHDLESVRSNHAHAVQEGNQKATQVKELEESIAKLERRLADRERQNMVHAESGPAKDREIEALQKTVESLEDKLALAQHSASRESELASALEFTKTEFAAMKEREEQLVAEIAALRVQTSSTKSTGDTDSVNRLSCVKEETEAALASERVAELEQDLLEHSERALLAQEELNQLRGVIAEKSQQIQHLSKENFALKQMQNSPLAEEKKEDASSSGDLSEEKERKLEQLFTKLEGIGVPFIKHGQRGNPKDRVLRCASGRQYIYYTFPGETDLKPKAQFELKNFALIRGKNHSFFKSKAKSDTLCFSLVNWNNGERCLLNIECKTEQDKIELVEGLEILKDRN